MSIFLGIWAVFDDVVDQVPFDSLLSVILI